jgi:hypothetical protein
MRATSHVPRDAPALAGIVRPLPRPIDLAGVKVEGDADAPFPRVRARTAIALACVDERLDLRTVKVASA